MKKTYIAPKTEMMEVAVESLLAASVTVSVDKNGSIDYESDFLSNESSDWGSDCWSK